MRSKNEAMTFPLKSLYLSVKKITVMTKADIVNQVADRTGVEKQTVLNVVEGFMESVKGSMVAGENVYLRGFGTFLLKQRAEKTARNISKGTTLKIPAHKIPAFKPAKSFAAKVK